MIEQPEVAPVAHPRTEKWALINAGTAIAVAVVAIVALLAAQSANTKATEAHKDVSTLKGVAQSANSKLTEHGIAPVPTPSIAQPNPTTTVTVAGPTATIPTAQLNTAATIAATEAVTRYFVLHPVRNGADPDYAALRRFITAEAAKHPGPRGSSGATVTGAPGASGASGQAAPAVSDAQLDQRLNAFCAANNNCQGPPGKDGATGATGAPGAAGAEGVAGRGIASLACAAPVPMSFTVTYTDGTTQTIDCTQPAPTDTPTPTGS